MKKAWKEKWLHRNCMDWVVKQSCGDSYFGLHPSILRRSEVKFDVFT